MFGTDLNAAYMPEPELHTQPPMDIKVPNKEEIVYDPNIQQPQILDQSHQIYELQQELNKQKQLNINMKSDVESLYDKFLSKKKEVFKLVNISLAILLAISFHFVLSDLVKSYIMNNDMSSNKELLTKFAYPMSVFMLLWSFKVFNK